MDGEIKTNASRAVLVSVSKGEGGFRINLDDVVRAPGATDTWRWADHVTNKLYSAEALKGAQLSEKEFADLGHYIIARLCAFIGRDEF